MRITTKILAFFLAGCFFVAPFFVSAEETPQPANPPQQQPTLWERARGSLMGTVAGCATLGPLGCIVGNIGGAVAPNATQQAVQATGQAVANGAAHVGLIVILLPVAVISFVILAFASMLLWLAGVLFNWSLGYLVYNFGVFFGNSTGLLLAWGILRDFGNIVLLFGFVYMGIQTILNIGHFNVGKTLSRLVIFAVLLNFSLFIAEGIVDISNALAVTVYNQTSSCDVTDLGCLVDNGLANEILERASLFSALGIGGVNNSSATSLGSVGGADVGVGGRSNYLTNPIGETLKFLGLALLVSTAAIVLFAGALLLISRAIHLTFLMVISPIGFAGMAVPWLEKMAGDWWNTLIKQAMFAPVFILLLFVALKVLDGLGSLAGSGGGIASAIQAQGGAIDTGPILFFALVIGFLIGALLTAKNFGIYAADTITKSALGMIKGVGSFPFTPYRDIAGHQAKNLGKKYNVLAGDWAKRVDTMRPGLLKDVVKATGAAVDSSIYGGLKSVQSVKVGGKSYADRQKEIEEREKSSTDALRRDTLKKDLGAAIEKARTTGSTDDLEKIVNTSASMSDLMEHKAFKGEDDAALGHMVKVMSSGRFKQLIENKDTSEGVKKAAKQARFAQLDADLATATAGGSATNLKQWSADDIAMSDIVNDSTKLQQLTHHMSDSQYESLTKSSNIGRQTIQRIKDIREGTGTGSRFADTPTAQLTMSKMKPGDVAKLRGSTLSTPHVMRALDPAHFEAIRKADSLSEPERNSLRSYIRNIVTTDPARAMQFLTFINTGLSSSDRDKFKKYFQIP